MPDLPETSIPDTQKRGNARLRASRKKAKDDTTDNVVEKYVSGPQKKKEIAGGETKRNKNIRVNVSHFSENGKSGLTQSLPKALKILEVLSDNPNGIALSNIVEQTDLNKSTAYRMLQTMQQIGYVEPGSRSGSYRPSFKIVAMGQKLIHGTNIIQLALPELTALNENLGETINLKVFRGDHSIILLKLEPKIGQAHTHAYMGMAVPLYLSATGKVFLAYRSESFVREYWQNKKAEIHKVTPFTITELPVFLERLQSVRENGYALDLGENEYGFACIAAPIFDYMGNVDYAVSIAMTTAKLQMSSIETFTKPLTETLRNISKSMGHDI